MRVIVVTCPELGWDCIVDVIDTRDGAYTIEDAKQEMSAFDDISLERVEDVYVFFEKEVS